LFQDVNEKIWVGTANGIYIYDPMYERFSQFDMKTANGEGVDGIVRDIKADKKGNIWIGVQDKGIFCYTNEEEMIIYPLKNTNLRKIEFDPSGNVWVATYGRGLLKINPQSAEVKEFLIDEKNGRYLKMILM
jgi:Predicted periplasmic ligand-binding sensor domain